jgi:hypothetical protein
VRVYLRDYGRTYASATADIASGQERFVELIVRDANVILRVMRADGHALPGAKVLLRGTDEVAEHHRGITNERGEFVVSGLARGRYVLNVSHSTHGIAPEASFDFAAEDTVEHEILLDGRANLDLQVLDSDVPLAGIACWLKDSYGNNLASAVLTNTEGRALIPRLTPGPYHLQVTSETTWPLELGLDVQPGAGLRTVEVRRLGDLLIRALNPDGVPVSGLDVEITDIESGEQVQDWLAADRVIGPDALATDLQGEIELKGLPRGTYAWKAGETEGSVVVKADAETLALLPAE